MPITPEKFPPGISMACPEIKPMVTEHYETYGTLLLHVLMADVTRFCVAAHQRGDDDLVRRCLDYLDACLQEGDVDVENAVCVSFVENVEPWNPERADFIATWPDALRGEAEAQAGRT